MSELTFSSITSTLPIVLALGGTPEECDEVIKRIPGGSYWNSSINFYNAISGHLEDVRKDRV